MALYFIIVISNLFMGCSSESVNYNNVNENLTSHKWIRDSYVNKDSNGLYKSYLTKAEFLFFENGNLTIKEPQYIGARDSGTIAPPPGVVDTLTINAQWKYSEKHSTITLKIIDTDKKDNAYNCNECKLTFKANQEFEIENTAVSDSIEKLNFKRKI